jgi:hypothetical protein
MGFNSSFKGLNQLLEQFLTTASRITFNDANVFHTQPFPVSQIAKSAVTLQHRVTFIIICHAL